ncbi:hypothetical protein KXV62_007751, partial [Aspergillus fumigatus]
GLSLARPTLDPRQRQHGQAFRCPAAAQAVQAKAKHSNQGFKVVQPLSPYPSGPRARRRGGWEGPSVGL